MTELEMRYRRLLVWYPTNYRHEYGEEIVGVLMEGAKPGQRFPRLADAADLVWSALVKRLGGTGAALGDRRWGEGAAVFAVLAPLMLLAERAREFVVKLGLRTYFRDDPELAFRVTGAFLAVFAALAVAVLVAVLAGWRRTAVVTAWLTVVVEVGLMVWRYPTVPVSVLYEMVPLTLAVTLAVALSVSRPARPGVTLLGWRSVAVVAMAGALWAATGLAALRGYGGYPLLAPNGMDAAMVALTVLATMALLWYAFRHTGPDARRRFVALIAPTIALILLVKLGFGGWIQSSPQFRTPVHLVPGQWLALLLTPLLAFGIAVLVIQQREETLRLVTLGRSAEARTSQLGATEPADSPAS